MFFADAQYRYDGLFDAMFRSRKRQMLVDEGTRITAVYLLLFESLINCSFIFSKTTPDIKSKTRC